MMNQQYNGTEDTKEFYNREGWQVKAGITTDWEMFGRKENSPIRMELHNLHLERIRSALSLAGEKINLLECGCGGKPASTLLDLCSKYTGVDFSEKGLEVAQSKLESESIPYQLELADICQLPFPEEQFDAVYSSHVLYHIEDSSAQKAALKEMLRVTKAGGVVVLILVNPRPLLFPVRLLKRVVADTPIICSIVNRLRQKPVLPYNPLPLSWMKHQLTPYGSVKIVTHDIPSIYFDQQISEYSATGTILWKIVRWLDIKFPEISAYLGNFVQVTIIKD